VQQKDKDMADDALNKITHFFDNNYKTPQWLLTKFSRRKLLKSAAGMTVIAAMPVMALDKNEQKQTAAIVQTEPWLTINAVLDHLLPESANGPSAKELRVLTYLYNVVHQQPTEQNEIDFIFKGVGWLNGFTKKQLDKSFVTLTKTEKETMLRGISRSTAGENWLNNLLGYIFEAMLSPPVYGGNPQGIGWKWLEHQAGFPLPKAGQRYYELPNRSTVRNVNASTVIQSKDLLAHSASLLKKGSTKS
jgi:gluconate 2-dehydrogenase gamma chain